MGGRLSGQRALVTAAAAGIGRATAEAFAREGAEVLATDIDAAGLASLAGPGLRTARLDVLDPAAISALVGAEEAFGILVNAAGMVPDGSILDCDDDAWARTFALNVTSMHRVTRAVLPGMLAAGGGSIINVGSVASSLKAVPIRYAYSASKAAVSGLTKAIAADFITRGIRCNAICPGTVETPSLAGRLAAAEDPVAARTAFIARQPMGRFGRPEEIASLAVYLASAESAFTTGAVHVIDGGWNA